MTANAILVIRNFLSSAHTKRKTINRNKGDAAMNNSYRNGNDNTGSHSSDNNSIKNEEEKEDGFDANSLLPRYLLPLVRHYHDDFYVSRSFDPRLIVQLMAEGFLPIATQGYLLPKLHVERCVLQLKPNSNLHISKSTRKKSKRFLLSVNECFDEVVAGCHRQHGTNWLYPPIVAAFRAIHQRTTGENSGGVNAMIMDHESLDPRDVTPVRLYTVEVWNAETGALAGGELGYSVGGIYSSLTGFSNEDTAGSVQLLALGKLLMQCGFEYWDLGMTLEYKTRLGAELIPRTEFVSKVKRSRVESKGVVLRCGGSRRNAKELVDWEQRPAAAAEACGSKQKNGDSQSEKMTDVPMQHPSSDKKGSPKPKRKRPHEEGKGE
mmetsp:Transcript_5570/g.10764  ORF Transcript_5570/g.10764 Transcript_5570/m.10764 type:complete len:378 (+) Transcript_5570:172-1305(+)|eukprot:CAMPEP_0201663272 /NCGR_PEP_ID=MMETSP0494-20130426/5126_1 /ASSEMBLY_ACC=CAM_ASM_000839 /TAXON_ID=420259 /ORGANISM="Thalassiosira gravida, Strain GMp14c1" /LENGTH=377 /DNA_ID=CAMNT_0048141835 /DNA_START=166 /DNA_END=1299 /DNA_ORIENTATION=+